MARPARVTAALSGASQTSAEAAHVQGSGVHGRPHKNAHPYGVCAVLCGYRYRFHLGPMCGFVRFCADHFEVIHTQGSHLPIRPAATSADADRLNAIRFAFWSPFDIPPR